MTDIKVPLPSFGKEVTVSVPDGEDLATAFNAASQFLRMLAANNQIVDMERGINPKGATHEIVADGHGGYELRRLRFGIA